MFYEKKLTYKLPKNFAKLLFKKPIKIQHADTSPFSKIPTALFFNEKNTAISCSIYICYSKLPSAGKLNEQHLSTVLLRRVTNAYLSPKDIWQPKK